MDRRVSEPGPLVGTGRAADVYDIGGNRVLRRYRTDHDSMVEATAMRALWAAGYPVPEIFDADGRDLVMERLEGSTMLDTLGRRPWRSGTIGDQLAELHVRLEALDISESALPVREEPAECIVHFDLHPGNVVLTPRGPVVIDWTNVGLGPRGTDAATTWILLSVGEADDIPVPLRPFVGAVRRHLLRRFLSGVERPQAAVIRIAGERRLNAPGNLRPAELTAIREFVATHAGTQAGLP